MAVDFARGLFIIVNSLLALYIVIYAFVFLTRTKRYPDRKPWELLFIGALVFLVSQVLNVTLVYNQPTIFGVDIQTIQVLLQFCYASLVLMAFITQSHLILLSDMILITKKVKKRKKKDSEEEDKK